MSMSSLFDLSNQTALVIGASRGLGERAATALSAAGARVIVAARSTDALTALSDRLPNALSVQMDVADSSSVKAAFEFLESKQEKINVVLCAAGRSGFTPVFDMEKSGDLFEKEVQTNLLGTWYVIQQAAAHMKKHKIAGSIITVASVSGSVRFRAGTAAYGSSKAGVIKLTQILTEELAQSNIRINCIAPGLFHTDMTDYKLHTPELKAGMASTIPVGFVADPEDLDGTVLYLASNRASRYVTGSCLTIDGGESWVRYEKFIPPVATTKEK